MNSILYISGPNPLFGGLKSTTSIFGKTGHIWIEGEGMLHALYFDKDSDGGSRTVLYKNKHVETETFKVEKRRNKPSFIPAIDGSPPAILLAYMFNMVSILILNLFPFLRSIILKHFFKVS